MGLDMPGSGIMPLPRAPGLDIWENLAGFWESAGRALAGAGGGRPYGGRNRFVNVSGGGVGSTSGGGGGGGLGRYYTGGWGIASDGSLMTPGISVAGQSYQEGRNKDMAAVFAKNLAGGSLEQRERLAIANAGKEAADAELTAARRAYFWAGVDLALLALELVLAVATCGASIPATGLVHLTSNAGMIGIRASRAIKAGSGIFAVTRSAARLSTIGRIGRTWMPAYKVARAIHIPNAATGLFRRPMILGPVSALRRALGVHYARATSLNYITGASTPLRSVIGPELALYAHDATFWGFYIWSRSIIGGD